MPGRGWAKDVTCGGFWSVKVISKQTHGHRCFWSGGVGILLAVPNKNKDRRAQSLVGIFIINRAKACCRHGYKRPWGHPSDLLSESMGTIYVPVCSCLPGTQCVGREETPALERFGSQNLDDGMRLSGPDHSFGLDGDGDLPVPSQHCVLCWESTPPGWC